MAVCEAVFCEDEAAGGWTHVDDGELAWDFQLCGAHADQVTGGASVVITWQVVQGRGQQPVLLIGGLVCGRARRPVDIAEGLG